MHPKHWNRIFTIVFLLAFVAGMVQPAATMAAPVVVEPAAPVTQADPLAKIEPLVLEEIAADGQTEFFVWMTAKADLTPAKSLKTKLEKGQFVFETLRATADSSQAALRAELDAQGVKYRPFYIANKIFIHAGNQELVMSLAARSDVASITPNRQYQLDEPIISPRAPESPDAIEPNISFIRAPLVWDLGFRGEGLVLAGNDTGLMWNHPAIINQYRGWNGSTADHNYNWWDATGAYPMVPGDGHGHGTHTTGTMVGDDGGTNQIGVAPGAQTIHCKNMTDGGSGSDLTFSTCFEWDLAPWDLTGSNPMPSLAPHAINNSWGYFGGNQPQFIDEVDALQAAGIVVEVSSGNEGPSCGSLRSPGDYAQVLTTGSIGHFTGTLPGTLTGFSSRGPSALHSGFFPDIMAPGENIRSSVPGGGYQGGWSGTSMAGPHATALIALMWQAAPGFEGMVDETYDIIRATAVPLTGVNGSNCGGDYNTGPNNDWGFGTIDALAAVEEAMSLDTPYRFVITPASQDVCFPDNFDYNVDVIQNDPMFTDPVTMSAIGYPGGYAASFVPNPVVPPGMTLFELTNTGATTPGSYAIDVVGVALTYTVTSTVTANMFTATPGAVSLTAPANGASNIDLRPTFQWSAATQGGNYYLEVATDAGFGGIVYTATVTGTSHQATSVLNPLTEYFWRVTAMNACGDGPTSATWSFTTRDIPPILLVDDDDNSPDVRSYYTTVLDNLGLFYDIWDTNNSDNEPSAAELAPYQAVIWFTGDSFGGSAGPGGAGEAALATWLDAGACFFISSQDYLFDRGLTPFMQNYLGVASFSHDVGQTSVTGAGSVFSGLGPYSLVYPFSNWSDRISPSASAELAFAGNLGDAAVNKDGGAYQTSFWGFPLEALPTVEAREATMTALIDWCGVGGDTGWLAGLITDGDTDEPIAGATVEAGGRSVQSNAMGLYQMRLPVGIYDVTASADNYMSVTETDVEVLLDETTVVDFELFGSILTYSPDFITESMQIGDVVSNTVTLTNTGPLDIDFNVVIGNFGGPSLQASRIVPLTVTPLASAPAQALVDNPFTASGRGAGVASVSAAPLADVDLVLDDGSRENSIGLTAGGQFIWLNRFTPAAGDFPFTLTEVQVLFGQAVGVNVGEIVDLYIYEDTDGDGNPGTNANFLGSYTGATVQAVDDMTWSVYTLPTPVALNGPGDVLIAVVNRTAGVAPGTFVASIDQSPPSAGRSWIGLYNSGNPADPPTLPADNLWGVIDTFGFAGNWMVRGYGSFGISGGWAYADPASGTVPANSTATFEVIFDASSLFQTGTYTAELDFNGTFVNDPPPMPLTMILGCEDCGFLEGEIFDDWTGDPLDASIHITGPGGFDVTLSGNSYSLAVQPGSYDFTVSAEGYFDATATVVVAQGQTQVTDFHLVPMSAVLEYSPAFITEDMEVGQIVSNTVTVTNTGTVPLDFSVSIGGYSGPSAASGAVPHSISPAEANFSQAAPIGPASARSPEGQAYLDEIREPLAWVNAAPMPVGLVRYAHVQCEELPNSFFVIAGVDPSFSVTNGAWRYDADTNSWATLAPIPVGQEGPAGVCYGGNIYVAGGGGTNQFYVYNLASNSWSALPALPRLMWGAAMGAMDGKIYMIGGDSDFSFGGTSNQVNIYDIAAGTWSTGAPMPTAAVTAGSGQAGQYVYVVGGWGDASPGSNINLTQRYDMASNTWELGPTFTSARADFALAITSSSLYAIAGDANGGGAFDPTNLVESLDHTAWPGGAWTNIADPLPQALTAINGGFCTNAVTGGEVWAPGGYTGSAVSNGNRYRAAEACFTGSTPWASADPSSGTVDPGETFQFEVYFDATSLYQVGTYTANLSFSGNFVNDPPIMPLTMNLSCPTCGYLEGAITDAMTGDPLTADITIAGVGGFNVTLSGDSYFISVPADTYTITVEANGYFPESATVDVATGETVVTDFALTLIYSELAYAPDAFVVDVPLGAIHTETLVISNLGTDAFDFTLVDSELSTPEGGAPAHSPTITCAPDAFGYTCTDSTESDGLVVYNFEDISGTGTAVSLSDDQVSAAIPMNFDFNYYGSDIHEAYISSNGFLTVLPGQPNGCCTGGILPDPATPNGVISGWWEDLNPASGGTIHYQTLGTAPFRYFIVQFTNVPHFGGGNLVTKQYKLFEGSNNIEVHYMAAPSDGGTHSAGIENQTGTDGLQYYRGTGSLPSEMAVCYLYPGQYFCGSGGVDAEWLTQTPSSGTVGAGESFEVTVTFDATNAVLGAYTAEIYFSGTFDNMVLPLPVTMNVVEVAYGVMVEPAEAALSGAPGETVTYNATITNTGNVEDTFDIEMGDHEWETHASHSTVTLGAGESIVIQVHVTIPADAGDGDWEAVPMTVRSQGDPDMWASMMMTTTAVIPEPEGYILYLPIVNKNFGD